MKKNKSFLIFTIVLFMAFPAIAKECLSMHVIDLPPATFKNKSGELTGIHVDFIEALEIDEIIDIVAQFKLAAKLAKKAGFDGVEVHGANGYIIDQFLRDGSNQRQDSYGGSIDNRMRFLNEVLDAVCDIWPVHRVGVRLSPENSFNSMHDSAPQVNFEHIVSQLNDRKLAYLHVIEGDMMDKSSVLDYRALRSKYNGTYMANNGYGLQSAKDAIHHESVDLVAFGTLFGKP